jgi:hypothetical protein
MRVLNCAVLGDAKGLGEPSGISHDDRFRPNAELWFQSQKQHRHKLAGTFRRFQDRKASTA